MAVDLQREGLEAFRRGTHPILLGTTVVEVGIDVPAANLMVVLGAEHFGVAQLHQLRGRVGRGGQRAGCLLVPEEATGEAMARLGEVAACHDGFRLAEMDMARRGAGEWFGARQSGSDTALRFTDPGARPRARGAGPRGRAGHRRARPRPRPARGFGAGGAAAPHARRGPGGRRGGLKGRADGSFVASRRAGGRCSRR